MRDQPWNNPEWNAVRDQARKVIATADRLLQHVDSATGERLSGAVVTLENARMQGSMEEITVATLVLRAATDELLRSLDLPAPRNGTSGVTGVENPDGEPSHGNGDV